MNKKEMAAKLAKSADISQAKALEIINSIFDAEKGIIASEIAGSNKVTLPGFGTFGARDRAARSGTNPATGEKMMIAAKTVPFFRAGKILKETVAS